MDYEKEIQTLQRQLFSTFKVALMKHLEHRYFANDEFKDYDWGENTDVLKRLERCEKICAGLWWTDAFAQVFSQCLLNPDLYYEQFWDKVFTKTWKEFRAEKDRGIE